MLKLLIKLRLRSQIAGFLSMQKGKKTEKKTSKLKLFLYALLLVYCVAIFLALFSMFFQQLAVPFYSVGIGWLYFTFAGLLAFALMFFGSIFTTKSQLYEARDNELLLSMPIPPGKILASRMIFLLLLNLFFELIVILPAGVIWCLHCPVNTLGIVAFVLFALLLPLPALALSAFFGWLIALISSRFRNKTFFTVLLTFLFLGVYWYGYSQVSQYINLLILHGTTIAHTLKAFLPLYWYGNAVVDGNLLYLLLTALVCLIPFAIVCYILAKTFLKTATTKRGFARIQYEEKGLKTSSIPGCLLRREFSRLLSCSAYIVNSGLGILFLLAGGVMLIIKKQTLQEFLSLFPGFSDMAPALAALALCMMIGLVLFTAPSISLEGKRLWILRSMPISTSDIFRAKLKLHLYITIPVVLFAVISLAYCLNLELVQVVYVLVCSLLFTLVSAEIGLICNLRHPNFDWISETQAVKSGVGVLFTMLLNTVLVFVPGALYLVILDGMVSANIFLLGYIVILGVISWLGFHWLMSRGRTIFETL